MKCQKCGLNEANTHIKKVINGKSSEMYLCSECAKEEGIGYTSIISDMQSSFENMLGSFFSNALPARTGTTHCKTCGSTYAEIARTGRVGCADCYSEFFDELLPMVRRIHGNTTHCGKRAEISRNADFSAPKRQGEKSPTVRQLQKELDEAVKVQDFERAAELRDKIREMNKDS